LIDLHLKANFRLRFYACPNNAYLGFKVNLNIPPHNKPYRLPTNLGPAKTIKELTLI